MKIVAISDTHGRHGKLRIPKGDVLIHAGDCTYRGERGEVENFLTWFSKQPHKYKIFIAGNHDFFFEKETKKQIKLLIPDSVIYLNDSGCSIDSINIWGAPYTPRFFNWAFNRTRGADIKKHWDKIPLDTQILITHGPPYGFLDTVADDSHVGDKDLLDRVRIIKPRLHVYGHIHESYGITKKSGTHFLNACSINEYEGIFNPPLVFDWEKAAT